MRNDLIDEKSGEVIALRRAIHAEPELGFQEYKTADLVAARLTDAGLEVHRDITDTAVVGVLHNGDSPRRIMFRAELDALPIQEKSGVAYASRVDGRMHACGHDGHTAILLGAAELLARTREFNGTLLFVFQPAEEVLGGGRTMIEAGLLQRFPADQVFSLHNWPGFPEGAFSVGPGPRMAAVDDFTVTFSGTGSHAAMPHLGDDPLLAAALFVAAGQRIVSRSVDPQSALVLSFTQIHGGSINNIVPTEVRVEGTCRFFNPAYSDLCEAELTRIAGGIADTQKVSHSLDYRRGYPAVVNPENGAATAKAAVQRFAPADRVIEAEPASMGCEDFSFLLNAVGDGCYVWIGAGDVGPGAGLHGDRYVFNDALVPSALRFWTELAAGALPRI